VRPSCVRAIPSGLDHDRPSTDALNRNLMHEAETRKTIMKWQIEKMAAAKFSSAAK
jgi:hypothetical protein